jgi:hypothetical protein
MTTRPRMVTVSALPVPNEDRLGLIYRVPGGSSTADSHWIARKDASNAYEWFQFDAAPVGGGAGTEYTEGDVDATITGVVTLWEDTSDTLRAVSAAKPLPVNVVAGGTSGTQYTETDTDASITGTAVLWEDTSDTLRAVSAAKPLPVNVVAGGTSGTQYNDGDASGSRTGNLMMVYDGLNIQAVSGNSAGRVDVDVLWGTSTAIADGQTFLTSLPNASASQRPTATAPFVYNGASWDRLRGDITNGLDVDVTRVQGSVAVTGTFWQATQPVSGTVTINAIPAGTNNIGDVDVLTLPALPTGANVIGAVTQSGTWTATPPTLTKGTQGATGFSVQELRDAGRNLTNFFNALPQVTTNAAVLVSLTGYKSGAAVAATTTPAVVTTGKTYRITTLTATYLSLAAATAGIVQIRANTGGVVAVGSPLVWQTMVGTPAAVAGVSTNISVTFPEGLEFAAGTGIGVTIHGVNATGVAAAGGYLLVSLSGYEY